MVVAMSTFASSVMVRPFLATDRNNYERFRTIPISGDAEAASIGYHEDTPEHSVGTLPVPPADTRTPVPAPFPIAGDCGGPRTVLPRDVSLAWYSQSRYT